MNEHPGQEPWLNNKKPDGVDDAGTQYLKSLCDRRDAAVENPFLSGEDLPEADADGGSGTSPAAKPAPGN